MKQLFLIIISAVTLFSCENIETNTPAMQGDIDNLFFKANVVRAERNEDNSYTIQGTNTDQILTLHIEEAELGNYPIGQGQPNFVTYRDRNENLYHSSPNGTGSIKLTDKCISCGWLSGTFNGMLILPGIDTLYVGRGVFFEASFLEGGILGNGSVANVREFWANVDGVYFQPTTSAVEVIDESIIITGAIGNRNIRIVLPVGTMAGAHPLSSPGFEASYNDGSTNEEAENGTIDVVFNTGSAARMRFNFETANYVIDNGRAFVDY
jgi:hypothetical protein